MDGHEINGNRGLPPISSPTSTGRERSRSSVSNAPDANTAKRRTIRYGITSLAPDNADAARLLALRRGRSRIENLLLWHKDASPGRDASLMHAGQGPTVRILLRAANPNLFHRSGLRRVAAQLRKHSQHPLPVGFGQDSGDQVPRHRDIERAVAQRVAHAAPLRRKRGTRLWRTRLSTRSPVSTASSRSKSESRRSLRIL